MKKYNVVILGATGAVGIEFRKILLERKFPIDKIRFLGSSTVGKQIDFGGRTVYFCCPGCAGEFAKDEAAGLKRVEEQMHANKSAYVLRQIEQALARPAGTQPTSQPAPAPKP